MCSSPRRVAPHHSFLILTDASWVCRICPAPLTAQTLAEHHNTYPCKEAAPSAVFFPGRASFPTCLLKFSAPSSSMAHPVPVPADATAIFHRLHRPQAQGRFIPPTPVLTVLFLPQKPLALRPQPPAQHLCVPSPRQPAGTTALPTAPLLLPWMLTCLQPSTTPPRYYLLSTSNLPWSQQ